MIGVRDEQSGVVSRERVTISSANAIAAIGRVVALVFVFVAPVALLSQHARWRLLLPVHPVAVDAPVDRAAEVVAVNGAAAPLTVGVAATSISPSLHLRRVRRSCARDSRNSVRARRTS